MQDECKHHLGLGIFLNKTNKGPVYDTQFITEDNFHENVELNYNTSIRSFAYCPHCGYCVTLLLAALLLKHK